MTKTSLITGATGDIGHAIAKRLCEENYNLILVSRTKDKLEQVRIELKEKYPNCKIDIQICDVSQPNTVAFLFQQLKENNRSIDVLVNCAGISGGGLTANIENDLWLNVINTNLNGMFFVIRDALHHNLVPSGGRIINIASTGGKQGVIHGSPYCASKHGMVGFTKALGLELARNRSGITVNAVCPGFVESEMAERVRHHYAQIWKTDLAETKQRIEERVPIGRYIWPREVAEMVAYLTSPHADGVTAQALNVCGGLGNY